MINYFIDASIVDGGSNDGLSPVTAMSTMFGVIPDQNADIKFWVRRGTYVASGETSFCSGIGVSVIGWPHVDDPEYVNRPDAGVTSGWDNDSGVSEIAFGTVATQIVCTDTIVSNITISDSTGTNRSLLRINNKGMILDNCILVGESVCSDLNRYETADVITEIKNSIIEVRKRVFDYSVNEVKEIQLPLLRDCILRPSCNFDSPLISNYSFYFYNKTILNIVNCTLELKKDVDSVIKIYGSGASGQGGISESEISLRIIGAGNVNKFVYVRSAILNSQIDLDFNGFSGEVGTVMEVDYYYFAYSVLHVANVKARIIVNSKHDILYDTSIVVNNCDISEIPLKVKDGYISRDSSLFVTNSKIAELNQDVHTVVENSSFYPTGAFLAKQPRMNLDIHRSRLGSLTMPTPFVVGTSVNVSVSNSSYDSNTKDIQNNTGSFSKKNIEAGQYETLSPNGFSALGASYVVEDEIFWSFSMGRIGSKSRGGFSKLGDFFNSPLQTAIESTSNNVKMYMSVGREDFESGAINIFSFDGDDMNTSFTIAESSAFTWSNDSSERVSLEVAFSIDVAESSPFKVTVVTNNSLLKSAVFISPKLLVS